MDVAICPGSFDPVTAGHLDIIRRTASLYDKVVVAVAKTPRKKSLFSLEERVKFIVGALAGEEGIVVEPLDCLLVEFAHRYNARVIIKGLRAISDFEHEFQMAQFNRKFDPKIETIFMMASPEYMFLSSSAVKEIAEYRGNLEGLVPPEVEKSLRRIYDPS